MDKRDLNIKLQIVKALTALDMFVDGKYYKLYCDYQQKVTIEFKEFYLKIMRCIEKYDYMNVASELLDIERYPKNQSAVNQITHLLASSINELIEKTKVQAIMLLNNLDTESIQAIVENLKKLTSARKYLSVNPNQSDEKYSIKYLDEETQLRLSAGLESIQSVISKKILSYLNNIEALISINDFYEAEEKREYISNIRLLLGNYCVTEEITKKIDQLQVTLEEIVDKLLAQYKEMPLNDYIINPPKAILDKLEKVAYRSLKYTRSLNDIKKYLITNIRKHLNEAKEAKTDERGHHIQLIQSALWSLPAEMKGALEVELQNLESGK